MDANALPKGHIIGWTPPPAATKPGAAPGSGAGSTALSKNAKKRQKQREKKAEAIKDNWEDDDDDEEPVKNQTNASAGAPAAIAKTAAAGDSAKSSTGTHTPEKPNWAAAPATSKDEGGADGLANKLEKLEVR